MGRQLQQRKATVTATLKLWREHSKSMKREGCAGALTSVGTGTIADADVDAGVARAGVAHGRRQIGAESKSSGAVPPGEQAGCLGTESRRWVHCAARRNGQADGGWR